MTQNPPNPYDPPPSAYPTGGQPGHPPAPGYGYGPVGPPSVYPRAADGTPISPWGPCAEWSERFFAVLWDTLYQWPAYIALALSLVAFGIGAARMTTDSTDSGTTMLIIAGVLYVVALGLSLWRGIVNLYLRQGRTGQSWGKAKRNLRLVRELDGQPAGGLICFARYLLGGLINQIVFLDIPWPLWDPQRQRLSDKILGLIVVVGGVDPSRRQLR